MRQHVPGRMAGPKGGTAENVRAEGYGGLDKSTNLDNNKAGTAPGKGLAADLMGCWFDGGIGLRVVHRHGYCGPYSCHAPANGKNTVRLWAVNN